MLVFIAENAMELLLNYIDIFLWSLSIHCSLVFIICIDYYVCSSTTWY